MANKTKDGLGYFPLEVSVFSDIKMRKLIKYQGGKAFAVYACLLCNIYTEGYYIKWDDELPFVISEATGLEEAYIQEVFKCCLQVGLFDSDLFHKEGIVTSAGIQTRYLRICKLTRKKFRLSAFILINDEELTNNATLFDENDTKKGQSKRKESKGNKNKNGESDAGSNSEGKALNGDIQDTGQSGINPDDDHPLKDLWNQIGMIYPKAENVGALPDHFAESLIRQVRVMKKVDLSMNEVRDLWEAWKLQKLDGKAEYRDMNGVYQNFVNTYRDKNIRSSNTQTHQQHDAEQAQLKRTKELLEKRNAGG